MADLAKAEEAYKAGKGPATITIALPLETDGKTNGFASNMMQLPPVGKNDLNMIKAWLTHLSKRSVAIDDKHEGHIKEIAISNLIQ